MTDVIEIMQIVVDSREQKPLFKTNVVNKKLDAGDYSIVGMEHLVSIERKGVLDLFGTLTKGHERFKREIGKSRKLKYFAIVIEGNFGEINNNSFDGHEHTKMNGEIINKILMTIHLKYRIPIFYCNGRVETKKLVRLLLESFYKLNGGK